MRSSEFVVIHELFWSATSGNAVDSDSKHLNRAERRNSVRDGLVDTTFDVVVFNCEDSVVGFLSISDDTISIDWLNREDIKHSSVDSLCCESLLSF